MDHLVNLSEEDKARRTAVLRASFENFILMGSQLLRLCPNCTFTIIHDYIKYLDEESNKKPDTEH